MQLFEKREKKPFPTSYNKKTKYVTDLLKHLTIQTLETFTEV